MPENEHGNLSEIIRLDGRKFHGITQALAANQDDYILAHLRLAGAIELLNDPDGAARAKEKLAEDLITRIYLSGRKNFILACCLTEEGKVWNRDEANRNAARFAALTDQDEKQTMQSLMVGFVITFFAFAAPPSRASRSEEAGGTQGEAQSIS